MHDDEVSTDTVLVRRLLAAQFPQWARLDIQPVRSGGSDNAMYRLGAELAVRLPRRPAAVRPMDKEHTWLARLAPRLPLPVPLPLAKGAPGEGYPWAWSVCRWIDGENPAPGRVSDTDRLAKDLAAFIRALQAIDADDAPRAGGHNYFRGAPLAQWEETIRERLSWLADIDDIGLISAAWEADAQTPAWDRPPVWIHGDLSVGNLLVRDGRLSGVIDWSCLGAGDPACELQVAWNLFDQKGRQAFRDAIAVDDATWKRGRAWGLAMGVLSFSYYRAKSPVIAEHGRRAIDAVLADVVAGGAGR
jgi:aminoglycoside phosphotransferase (APT) family kinase protein